MELMWSFLTSSFADLRFNYWMIFNVILVIGARVLMFLFGCATAPLIFLTSLKKRERCPPVRNKILLYSGAQLAEKIRQREISSEQVIRAYVERCKEVNPVLNAIVEDRFENAIQDARQIDLFLQSSNKSESELARDTPLLGLPVTVKESIAVKGMSNTVGVKRRTKKAGEDAEIVKKVRKAGGIPLLVSNTPELCMFWETYNNIIGLTCNPYDTKRTAGGSSGGESALLGSAASLFSLCSDIAGSSRLPAMFCGVFGYKPSPGWLSNIGHRPTGSSKDWDNFFTLGTMVRYMSDLPLLLKCVYQTEEMSRRLDEKVDVRNIRYYYLENNGSIISDAIDAEIICAIREVVKHFETVHGAKVQPANLKEMKHSFEISAFRLLSLNNLETVFSTEDKPEEWSSVSLELLKFLCFLSPHNLYGILYGILKKIYSILPRSYLNGIKERSVSFKKEFEAVLGDNGVLIFPSFISAAHHHYGTYDKVHDISYMMIFNVLGLPVVQCPVGFNKDGLPIGVQIVANAGHDHLCVAVAQEIEKAFGGWQQASKNERIV